VYRIATEILSDCPSLCEKSCIDCLQTFRNGYYHQHLDRTVGLDRLREWGSRLRQDHDIPPRKPSQEPADGGYPVNQAERRLHALLRAAGFEDGIRGEQIRLDRTLGSTTPDVIYRSPSHDEDEGVCIYLDGMSRSLHGDPVTAERDRQIRSWLRSSGFDVIEITATELHDRDAMVKHFRRLARYLGEGELADRIRQRSDWFHDSNEGDDDSQAEARESDHFRTLCQVRPVHSIESCGWCVQ
jgi:hypothetical protein